MTKKDYIFNMANLIKNRVNYHAPINYDGDVDYEKIFERKIDLTLPVFIMEKPMKKPLLLAFKEAQKKVDFNLILREKSRKIQKAIKNCFVVKHDEIPSLDKLNINYKAHSTYHRLEKGNYLRIEKIIDDFEQKTYFLQNKGISNGIFYTVKKFLLNGENILIDLANTERVEKKIKIEYNHELERGYYSFEKLKKGLKIVNLNTNCESYFNASFGKVDENYSCIDGLENSCYARINFKAEIKLKPFEKKSYFINLGQKYFTLNNKAEMDFYFELSQKKNFEVFDSKIECKNKFLERQFNKILPLKIWNSWIEGKRDMDSERKYLDIKNSLILRKGKEVIIAPNKYGVKRVLTFNGKEFKQVVGE